MRVSCACTQMFGRLRD